MHMALRSLLAVAALGLALAPAASAGEATSDLFVVRDACGGADGVPPDTRLAFDLGLSTLGCGSTLAATGGTVTQYPAKQGVPVTLDVSRPIHVAISTESFAGVAVGGIGDERIAFTLTGKRTGSSTTVTLGTGEKITSAADMLRKPAYTAEFDLPLTPAKAGTYKSLNLELQVGGSQFSGFVKHDGSSYVSLPVFDPIEEPAE